MSDESLHECLHSGLGSTPRGKRSSGSIDQQGTESSHKSTRTKGSSTSFRALCPVSLQQSSISLVRLVQQLDSGCICYESRRNNSFRQHASCIVNSEVFERNCLSLQICHIPGELNVMAEMAISYRGNGAYTIRFSKCANKGGN